MLSRPSLQKQSWQTLQISWQSGLLLDAFHVTVAHCQHSWVTVGLGQHSCFSDCPLWCRGMLRKLVQQLLLRLPLESLTSPSPTASSCSRTLQPPSLIRQVRALAG